MYIIKYVVCVHYYTKGKIMSLSNSHTQQRNLTADTVATIAERRVRGISWAELGAEFGWDGNDLRNAIHRIPDFQEELEFAKHEFLEECEGQMLIALREKLDSENEMVSLKAAMTLVKFLAAKQRDASREKVISMRAEIASARANMSDAKPTAKTNAAPQPREVTPPANPHATSDAKSNTTPHAKPNSLPNSQAKPNLIVSPTGAVIDLSVAPLG
jgi:hypothetical protein